MMIWTEMKSNIVQFFKRFREFSSHQTEFMPKRTTKENFSIVPSRYKFFTGQHSDVKVSYQDLGK